MSGDAFAVSYEVVLWMVSETDGRDRWVRWVRRVRLEGTKEERCGLRRRKSLLSRCQYDARREEGKDKQKGVAAPLTCQG
jgi:hypothetical protein